MRLLITLFAALALSATTACDTDRAVPCTEAYQHLLSISKRNHDPKLQRRFVQACMGAFDDARLTCLMAAETPDAAVSCRAVKKRPG